MQTFQAAHGSKGDVNLSLQLLTKAHTALQRTKLYFQRDQLVQESFVYESSVPVWIVPVKLGIENGVTFNSSLLA